MNININGFVAIILTLLFAANIAAQNTFEADCPNYQIDIYRNGSSYPETLNDLQDISACGSVQGIFIGKNYGSTLYHAVYQWTISDLDIPDGSTIHNVTVRFRYNWTSQENLYVNYFNSGIDIADPNLDLLALWNSTDKTLVNPIGNGFGNNATNHTIVSTFNEGSSFANEFSNSLTQYRVTLGIAWMHEGPTAGDVTWTLWPNTVSEPSITVSYTPPNRLVTIDQRLSSGVQVGELRKWEGTQFTDPPFAPGTQFYFPISSDQTILGDQTIISNQKYNNWNEDFSDVKNFHHFDITPTTENLTSNFEQTYSNITIKNSLESTETNGGELEFKDPWFIDYPDPAYANQLRNRGMDEAEWRTRLSEPFNPDYYTVFDNYPDPNQSYKGVFLNQGWPNWDPPYYSVKADQTQPINLGGSIGTRDFFFLNWSGTAVQFENANALETGVVFTDEDAEVNANLKGNLLSNSTSGFSSNSQRKLVRTDDGIFHLVYVSLDQVWYTHSLTGDSVNL